LVAWKAGNLWGYEPFVDDVTGLIIGAEYNAQTTISGVPAMVTARVKYSYQLCDGCESLCHECGDDRPDS
jgi:hypothetical protein